MHCGVQAEEVHYLDFGVEAVGRQEVYFLSGGFGRVYYVLELAHFCGARNACACGHFAHACYGAVPYYVVDVDFIAHEVLAVVVNVDYSHKAVPLPAEEVEERAVLAELVGIGWVVCGAVVVSENQYQAAFR